MTTASTTVHATPADRATGRLNALIAACLQVDPSRVLPGARLREDLGGHPLSLMRLAIVVEVELGRDPVPWSCPESGWRTCADVVRWAEERAGVPA